MKLVFELAFVALVAVGLTAIRTTYRNMQRRYGGR